jgi:hypothetical protein
LVIFGYQFVRLGATEDRAFYVAALYRDLGARLAFWGGTFAFFKLMTPCAAFRFR